MTIIPWYVKLGAVVALFVALVTGALSYRSSLIEDGKKIAINERAVKDKAKELADTKKARKDEADLAESKYNEQAERLKRDQDHEKDKAELERRLRSGADSLRIATAAIRAGSSPQDSAPISRPTDTQDTRLLPETSVAILGIAGDSAKDVRDYNALMVEYERVRAICNK